MNIGIKDNLFNNSCIIESDIILKYGHQCGVEGQPDKTDNERKSRIVSESNSKRKKTSSFPTREGETDYTNQVSVWSALCPWSLLENEIYLYKKNPTDNKLESILENLKKISINFDFWSKCVLATQKQEDQEDQVKECNTFCKQNLDKIMLEYIDRESESVQNFIFLRENPKKKKLCMENDKQGDQLAKPTAQSDFVRRDQIRNESAQQTFGLADQLAKPTAQFSSGGRDSQKNPKDIYIYHADAPCALDNTDPSAQQFKELTESHLNLTNISKEKNISSDDEFDYAQMYFVILNKYQRALKLISSLENENERLYELFEEKRS